MAYFQEAAQMLIDIRGWLFLIVTGVAALYIIGDVIEYIRGKAMEKSEAWKNIQDKLWMIAAAYFLVWLVTYIAGRFSRVTAINEYVDNTKLAANYIKALIS